MSDNVYSGAQEFRVDPCRIAVSDQDHPLFIIDQMVFVPASEAEGGFTPRILNLHPLKSARIRVLTARTEDDPQAPAAIVLIHRMNENHQRREIKWQQGEYDSRGYHTLLIHPHNENRLLSDFLLSTAHVPRFNRQLHVAIVRDPSDGKLKALLGVSGQRFSAVGPGPDAPIDDSEEFRSFGILDYDLLPRELQILGEDLQSE